MTKIARTKCPHCAVKMERTLAGELPKGWICGRCSTGIPLRGLNFSGDELQRCVVCNYAFFYLEKDFPRTLSFTIIGIGIGLSFFTYGISLILCGLIDWLLYHFLPTFRVCYTCETEYRGFPEDKSLNFFDPHKGVAYDARRALPKL